MIESDALDSQEGFNGELESSQTSSTVMKQKKIQLRQNQLVRENRRLRNSASFRVGKLLTRAATRPWLLLILPFSIFHLLFSIGMERLGRWPAPVDERGTAAVQHEEMRDCVMFFPTNGVASVISPECMRSRSGLRNTLLQQRLSSSPRCRPCICSTTKVSSPTTLQVEKNTRTFRRVGGMRWLKSTFRWPLTSTNLPRSFSMVPSPIGAC